MLATYIVHNNGQDSASITLVKHIWQIKHLASGHWSVEADKRGGFSLISSVLLPHWHMHIPVPQNCKKELTMNFVRINVSRYLALHVS